MGGDELNVLVAGRNYGWPLVSFGPNDSGTQDGAAVVATRNRDAGIRVEPVVNPTNILFHGDRVCRWRGSLSSAGSEASSCNV